MVSAHLIRALALQLKLNRTCPMTPLHIAGEENSMTDIPSRSFGSKPKWHCKSNTILLILFNNLFPICSQNSWTIFQISYAVGMQVTSLLRMKDSTLDKWRQLPKVRKHVGAAGQPMLHSMGVDPFLQDTPFTIRVCLLTDFLGLVRTGY
jgi:hypothetical protein